MQRVQRRLLLASARSEEYRDPFPFTLVNSLFVCTLLCRCDASRQGCLARPAYHFPGTRPVPQTITVLNADMHRPPGQLPEVQCFEMRTNNVVLVPLCNVCVSAAFSGEVARRQDMRTAAAPTG